MIYYDIYKYMCKPNNKTMEKTFFIIAIYRPTVVENMFSPIFKSKFLKEKHSERSTITEPNLPSFRRPKSVVQQERPWA